MGNYSALTTSRISRGGRNNATHALVIPSKDCSNGSIVAETYIPALRFRPLTHWYDFLIKATIRESTFKSKLVEQTCLQPGQLALDLGCGTGTLTLMLKSRYPEAEVTGIDADSEILDIARKKASAAKTNIAFQQAMSFDIPFPNQFFDCIASSLLFHHLTPENKLRTLHEIHRVLKPGGTLHIADFGLPRSVIQRLTFLWVQLFDGFASTSDSVAGALPNTIFKAGFSQPAETAAFSTMFGTIRLLQSQK